MALQGTIDAFPLVDVLQLLSTSHKTGRLVVEGDRGAGQLFVVDGLLVGGGILDRNTSEPDATVFEFLRFTEGSFLFEPGGGTPEVSWDPIGLVEVLDAATALLAEWAVIEEVVPTLDHRVRLVPVLPTETVKIDSNEWSVLVAVGSAPPVATLAETLGLSDLDACRQVSQLVSRGLAAVEEPDPGRSQHRSDRDTGRRSELASAPTGELRDASGGEHGDTSIPEPSDTQTGVGQEANGHDEMDQVTTGTGTSDIGAAGFPEHFPIDDLVGSDASAEDPWKAQEAEQVDDDRFAAAQTIDAQVEGGWSGISSTAAFSDVEPEADTMVQSVPEMDQPAEGASVDGTDEVLRQMSKLSPKAAEAIAAALDTPDTDPAEQGTDTGSTFLRSF